MTAPPPPPPSYIFPFPPLSSLINECAFSQPHLPPLSLTNEISTETKFKRGAACCCPSSHLAFTHQCRKGGKKVSFLCFSQANGADAAGRRIVHRPRPTAAAAMIFFVPECNVHEYFTQKTISVSDRCVFDQGNTKIKKIAK